MPGLGVPGPGVPCWPGVPERAGCMGVPGPGVPLWAGCVGVAGSGVASFGVNFSLVGGVCLMDEPGGLLGGSGASGWCRQTRVKRIWCVYTLCL